MKRSVKTCIAYLAGASISGKTLSGFYDCSKDKRVSITGDVSGKKASVTHHGKGFTLAGTLDDLRDEEGRLILSIKFKDRKFSGKDQVSGTKFKGEVRGKNVSLIAEGYYSYRMEW